MNKRITSMLLAFVMVIGLLVSAVPVFSAEPTEIGSASITVSKEELNPGDEFTVTVSIAPLTTKISNFFVAIKFDNTVFEATEFTAVTVPGSTAGGLVNTVDEANTNSRFVVANHGVASGENEIDLSAGISFTVAFKVKAGVPSGTESFETQVQLDYLDEEDYFTVYNLLTHSSSNAGPEKSVEIKGAHVHNLTAVAAVEATCETDGNIAYYECECGKYFEDADAVTEITDKASVVIPATGHDWDEGTVTTEPTETAKGVKTFTCKNDASHTKTEEIPELGHQCKLHLTAVEAKEADCETAGNIAHYVCECGKYYADSEAETELSEEDVIIDAGHAWSEWTETTAPTCTDKGEETRICTKECGVDPETREIPALGHAWGEWITTLEPTVEAKGEERRDCDRCDAYETRELAQLEDDSFMEDWYWTMIMLHNQIFEIEADASEGGTITPDGIAKVHFARDAKYIITPDEGYEIEAVYVDGVDVGAADTYTFKRVTKDHSIYAVFAEVEEDIEAPAIEESLYDDVDADDWFYDDVVYVTENGLMNGTGDDIFSPEVNTTRAMIVTILWRLEGEADAESAGFTDVADDMWYTEAIDWAAANGIVNGFGDGTFGPEKAITREQVMAILHRYAAYKGWDDGMAVSMIAQYDCSVWAENDVNWADLNGILADLGVDVYDMTAEADRAEIAAYFTRFCLNVAE